jgi:hypothetical protein
MTCREPKLPVPCNALINVTKQRLLFYLQWIECDDRQSRRNPRQPPWPCIALLVNVMTLQARLSSICNSEKKSLLSTCKQY